MPLLVSSSGNSNPTISIAEKGTKYRVTASGDSYYVLMNGYKGSFTLENTGYSPKLPTIIYEDGTKSSSLYTTYQAKGISALKLFCQVNQVNDYYITFN